MNISFSAESAPKSANADVVESAPERFKRIVDARQKWVDERSLMRQITLWSFKIRGRILGSRSCELLLRMVLSTPLHPQLGENFWFTRKRQAMRELHPLDCLNAQ
jgi:hypothetical protein